MTAAEWLVVAGGIAAIAWVNWYFFIAERAGSRGRPPSGEPSERGAQHGNDRG